MVDVEELNRLVTPADSTVDNFGWPCYEGVGRQGSYDALNLNVCENLYTAGTSAVVAPYYTYRHSDSIVSGEACSNGQGSSTVGMAFYTGGAYPDAYDGALFFADYSRDCLWVMTKGADGLPDPASRANFLTPAANPVHLEIGPCGGPVLRRLQRRHGPADPVLRDKSASDGAATATPASGPAPLTVHLRRHRLERPGRRRAQLRVGSGRRRGGSTTHPPRPPNWNWHQRMAPSPSACR